jgi:2'-5' RNA ligase
MVEIVKQEDVKRLFFGVEIHAPWPQKYPKGRMLNEEHRHLTLSFLGNVPFHPLEQQLENIPLPEIEIGISGYFDSCLLLPPRRPHVVAWHAKWGVEENHLFEIQNLLSNWLSSLDYSVDSRPWKPHVTLCRKPFKADEWLKAFVPLPFYTSSLHLYESTGDLHYSPVWSRSIQPPFEEIEHTADLAFLIRGHSLQQIYQNAATALAFKESRLLHFGLPLQKVTTLDDIVMALNGIICLADAEFGCPMKAVSFHGEIVELPNTILQWEMIVDV